MKWSKIQFTNLATDAFVKMCDNEITGCSYHNNNHIAELYLFLEKENVPYDEALDWAVMFHDVVYDNLPDKELRSAELFLEWLENVIRPGCKLDDKGKQEVYDLILCTKDHILTDNPKSSIIIRADLHGLADKLSTIKNFTLIAEESMSLYDCSLEEFAANSETFMRLLHQRIIKTKKLDDRIHQDFYDAVLDGILDTITLSKMVRGE